MKRSLMVVAVLAAVSFSSCKSSDSSDPKTVLTSFFDALGKKDIATARKYATAESKSMLDMMESAMKTSPEKGEPDEKFDKSKMDFGEPKIEGDKATVEVKEKGTGEATNFTLKKESGAWKVAFDKTSMMSMGMDKMKEKGVDSLNDINKIDSLGDKVKEGLEHLDANKEKLEDAAKKLEEAAKKMNN